MSAQHDDKYVYLYDTTLRDGSQTPGVNFTLDLKNTIARLLDELGIDYIEGGWPGANRTDTDFFAAPPALQAAFVAFGMTCRKKYSAPDGPVDPVLDKVLNAADHVCLFGKSWDYHVAKVLNVELKQYLEFISNSVLEGVRRGREVIFDAEHFFDGYKANPQYALDCLKAACNAGASWIVLCDTNGGTLPHEIFKIVSDVKAEMPEARLGIHAHNDKGCAVANSLEAIRAGCILLQGTLNGLGERCGNADLITLIPLLRALGFDLGVSDMQMQKLTFISKELDKLLDRPHNPSQPYTGENAFTHAAGVHSSAVLKAPDTYEHTTPESVGNKRKIIMSKQAGSTNVIAWLRDAKIPFDEKDPRLTKIVEGVKQKECEGYTFNDASGSLALLAQGILAPATPPFEIIEFSTSNTVALTGEGKKLDVSNACITLRIGDLTVTESATGNGPVNALDLALRRALEPLFPDLREVHLSEFHVPSLNTKDATAATTRVCIGMESPLADNAWRTIGVSSNVVSASLEALCDGYKYFLAFVAEPKPELTKKIGIDNSVIKKHAPPVPI